MASLKRPTIFTAGLILLLSVSAQAAVTPEQEIRARELQKKEEKLREKVERPRKPAEQEVLPALPTAPESAEKALITKINVTGFTILSDKEINAIIAPFENKELTMKDMQHVANLITDAYRQKGYVNSTAYLPPQDIKQGVLEIKVVEVLTGNVEIKGNRYFKTSLLRQKIHLKAGEPFNYNVLKEGITEINKQPDRNAHAVLMPGKEPRSTDVVLEVKDRLPLHAGFSYDNFGSRYINKNRYGVNLADDNLFGWDDKLSAQFQATEASRYSSEGVNYALPVGKSWEAGFSAYFSKVKLGRELEDYDIVGKSRMYGVYARNAFINKEDLDINLNFGLDDKDVINSQQGEVTSHDRLFVAKTGFDVDVADQDSRTLSTYELDAGLPHVLGSMSAKDPDASVNGAGGKFVKHTINLLRLQSLPWSTQVLWKNQLQVSPYVLPSVEQFQIGGIANVRGYAPATAVGDSGFATTLEWSLPVYPVSKNVQVPFSKAKLYDALRLAVFYDYASSHLREPSGDTKKNATLRSVGCGLRFNLPENFALKLDLAWPSAKKPSDHDTLHTWLQVSKNF